MVTSGMVWLEPQEGQQPTISVPTVVPTSFLDVLALIPLMMLIFMMSFAMKAIEPEVVREVAPEVRRGVTEVVGIYKGVPPLPEYQAPPEERKLLPLGRD